jgi:predicted membrane chloride channel (bestrophin family)
MLTYNKTSFVNTLFLNLTNLFNLRCLSFSLVNVLFSYVVVAINENVESLNLNNHLTSINMTLNVFNFFLATTISFRLNNAYNSWSKGFTAVATLINLSKRFFLIASLGLEDLRIYNNIHTDIINYIAYTFYLCRGSNGRTDYDGLRSSLLSESLEHTLNDINVKYARFGNTESKNILEMSLPDNMILTYIERDIRRHIGKLSLNEIDKNSMHALFSSIVSTSDSLYGIANVPVVHIYNQFINVCIISYLIIFTISMAIISSWYTGIWVFIWSSIIFLANEVSNQIDTPFGDDENDIELEIILNNTKHQFNVLLNDLS